MRLNFALSLAPALADLDTVEDAVTLGMNESAARAAKQYAEEARATTPVSGLRKRRFGAYAPLRSGWLVRQPRWTTSGVIHQVVNTRPHAHLFERGYQHVSGRRVEGRHRFIPLAQRIRAAMVREQEALLGPSLNGRLRALQVTP
jgi:hypothetical protein